MSLFNENCPKCGHTLEAINGDTIECFNADCDLQDTQELRDYIKNHDINYHDIKR